MNENDAIPFSLLKSLCLKQRLQIIDGFKFLGFDIPDWVEYGLFAEWFAHNEYLGVSGSVLVLKLRSQLPKGINIWNSADIKHFISLTSMEQ